MNDGPSTPSTPSTPSARSMGWPMPLLDDRAEWVSLPMPKGWAPVSVHCPSIRRRLTIYINQKSHIAQWVHPGKDIYEKMSFSSLPNVVSQSHSKGKGKTAQLLPISPQPPSLLEGWLHVIQIPAKFKLKSGPAAQLPQLLYVSDAGVIQASDPTPPPKEHDEHTLPAGWAMEHDLEGDVYFMNRNLYLCSYDDPRVFPNPMPSKILKIDSTDNNMRSARRVSTVQFQKVEGDKAAWRISAKDQFAFNLLDYQLAHMREDVPQYAQNKKVNRYLDIVPHAHSRVVLQQEGPDPLTTYINANWVSSFSREKKFIAAMGPLPSTLVSFWRMIIENEAQNVCMLTNLVEKGKRKCEPYFPILEGEDMEIGPFKIRNTKRVQLDGYVLSKLLVKFDDDKSSRTINHWWYNTWPDHDVPRDEDGHVHVESLLNMVDSVKRSDSVVSAPIVVHCSAGVGRTGTFVGIHVAQDELITTKRTDLIMVIEQMRSQRSAMVQHLSQFLFIHDAITRFSEIKGKSYIVEGGDEEDTMELANDEDHDLDSIVGEDESTTAENRRIIRAKEKAEAKKRRDAHEKSVASGTFRKIHKTASEDDGEIHLGPILYKGKEYHFNDINGDGVMDWSEAKADGYPEELFQNITGGEGDVTVSKYTRFQAKAARKSFLEFKTLTVGKSLRLHKEMGMPWFAGETSMMTVVRIVQQSVRGNFLVRRSARNPLDFHIICCIATSNGNTDAGKYKIAFSNETQLYTFGGKPYKSLEKIVAACRKGFLLQDHKGPFKLAEAAKIFGPAAHPPP